MIKVFNYNKHDANLLLDYLESKPCFTDTRDVVSYKGKIYQKLECGVDILLLNVKLYNKLLA